jgi:hypothetical protein
VILYTRGMIHILLLHIFIWPSFKSTIEFVKPSMNLINRMVNLKIKCIKIVFILLIYLLYLIWELVLFGPSVKAFFTTSYKTLKHQPKPPNRIKMKAQSIEKLWHFNLFPSWYSQICWSGYSLSLPLTTCRQ